MKTNTLAALFLGISIASPAVHAAELRVISSTGLNPVINELTAKFESASGHKLSLAKPDSGADVKKRIDAGEVFDLAMLDLVSADDLIKSGKAVADSKRNIVRVGIGLAVRAGSPKPDISTVDAFTKAVLGAKSITFTTGGSGIHFQALLKRLNIEEQVKGKLKQVGGGQAIPAVAKGEVELGVDIISQIVPVQGVDLVGPLPGDLQSFVTITVIMSSSAKEPAAARAFIDFLKGPVAAPVFKVKGLDPS